MIEVKNLSKRYGKNYAVEDISFSVKEGEILGFLGPNGAGKSTTMNMLTGYISATSGSASVAGIDILENPIEAKKHIGYLPELPPLYLDMTVKDYLDFAYSLKKVTLPKRAHIQEICGLVKIEDVYGRLIGNLSKGYRQRVGVAQALLGNPDVLILDEPTAGLDPRGRDVLLAQISQYHKTRGNTVLLVSHSMEDIGRTADRVLVMNRGKAALLDETKAVFAKGPQLEEMGLRVPQITKIMQELEKMGLPVDPSTLTVDDALHQLIPIFKRKEELR